MAIKKIITTETHEQFLRQKSKKVITVNDDVRSLINDLFDTLRAGDDLGRVGVGLAAPQINIPLRIAVVEYRGDRDENENIINALPSTPLINPQIIKYSKEKETMDEGCFSIPEYYGPVERPKKIRVKTLDLNGQEKVINASGYYARVIQHEIDHLDGILYTDYVAKNKLYKHTMDTKEEASIE